MSERISSVTALLVAVGTAGSALAQDSVSVAGGLPGDALSPQDLTRQVVPYVVDLSVLTTSWGTDFGAAPVVKTCKDDPAFFNNLMSAQGISRTIADGVDSPLGLYWEWNFPGGGVNSEENQQGVQVPSPSLSNQLALAFAEFGTTPAGLSTNNVVGAVINWDPADIKRLYVKRVVAGVNSNAAGTSNESQIGFGGVDALGNVHFRADEFGTVGGTPLFGDNYFRVDMCARNAAQTNLIHNPNGSDAAATDRLIADTLDTIVTPTVIGEDLAGRPVLMGADFNNSYRFESAAGVMTTAAPLAHMPGSSATRGNPSFSDAVVFAGSVGTGGQLGQDAGGATVNANIWGVNANGAISGTAAFTLPAAITDRCDGFSYPGGYPAFPDDDAIPAPFEFYLYRSQVAFRGGNGQIAVGKDVDNKTLVAATFQQNTLTGSNNPDCGIAVARWNCAHTAVEWTLAAYNYFYVGGAGPVFGGKPILDGPGGNAIGQLTTLDQVTGGAPLGPSLSAPMIDSVGNVWFVSAVELFDRIDTDGDGQPDASDFDSALIRAVYNRTTFCYELELIMELGTVITGANSGLPYQIQFLGIADSNSVDSAAAWSGNICRDAANGRAIYGLQTRDPRTLGGLVVRTNITYDRDGDGDFDDPTSGGGDPFSLDESYEVALFIGALASEPFDPCQKVDINGDGTVNGIDVGLFLQAYSAGLGGAPAAYPGDFNGDCTVNGIDVGSFLGLYAGCL